MVFNFNHNHQLRKQLPTSNKTSSRNRKLKLAYEIFICVIIRLFFIFQAGFSIYFLVSFYEKKTYLVLVIFVLVILIDAFYVSIYRKGKEYTW